MLQYLFALLPVAATCGWYLGNKSLRKKENKSIPFRMRHDYFKGLNYLINEQPDKAVDVFIKLLEVDTDTVETHLALGNLFRRRGEVERAIRIHQNIIARPNLAPVHRFQALSELGQDYLRAGVLDRAERLFVELIELGEENFSSYQFLLTIYQREKDWVKAIDIAKKLQALGKPMGVVIAQYYCELAERYLEQGNRHPVQALLKKAQNYNPACIRAHLIRAQLAFDEQNYRDAIHYYKKAVNQELIFLSEVIVNLIDCYHRVDAAEEMFVYFKKCLLDYSCDSLVLAIAGYLKDHFGCQQSVDFVTEQMQLNPSLNGLKYLLANCGEKSGQQTTHQLASFTHFIERLTSEKAGYRCVQCGFSAKSLFWLCPGCQQWETIKPSANGGV